jgi:serine/threonine protein kinase
VHAIIVEPDPEFLLGEFRAVIEVPSPVTLELLETNLEGEDKQLFLSFMRKMLQWDPKRLHTPKELLKDEWFIVFHSVKFDARKTLYPLSPGISGGNDTWDSHKPHKVLSARSFYSSALLLPREEWDSTTARTRFGRLRWLRIYGIYLGEARP